MTKTLLFISTDATRTGTPILLLDIIKQLTARGNHKIILVLQGGGDLLDEYKIYCEVHIWPNLFAYASEIKTQKILLKIFFTGLNFVRITLQNYVALKLRAKFKVDLIFLNSARNGHIIDVIKKFFKSKVVLYVHEGERILAEYNSNMSVARSISASNVILTVSENVKNTLIKSYQPKVEIQVIPGGVNTYPTIGKVNSNEILLEEGIDKDKIILMSCGWLNWHKGIDIFILLAARVCKLDDKFHFVWLGGSEKDEGYQQMKFDIEKLGLTNRITIITAKSNPRTYISGADLFLMLSREESFSLVTIEAGAAKIPVLCFDKIGGPLEILNYDKRFIVPYLDIDLLSSRIQEITNDGVQYDAMSNFIYNRVLNNYTMEKCAESVMKVINDEIKTE